MTINPRQFKKTLYHGSPHDFVGNEPVLPADVHGGSSLWGSLPSIGGTRASEHAYATTSESTAWEFSKGPGRSRVHTVEPNRQMRPGIHSELQEYVAPYFDRTSTIDIRPGQQGTFPQEDWHKYSKFSSRYGDQANHPSHGDTEDRLLSDHHEALRMNADMATRESTKTLSLHDGQLPLPGMDKPPHPRSKEFSVAAIQHLL